VTVTTQAAIRIDGVSRTFVSKRGETVQALDHISFDVDEGEFVSIVGPSGCGKSTLLKIIAGLIPPSAGQVLIGGQPVAGPRSDIGFVFQQPVLLPWRTVKANVMLPVEVLKLDRRDGERRAADLLETVGLSNFANHYPMELSGGMQQRVGIARALVHDPVLLLMDEPFGALDAMTRDHMTLELLSIWRAFRKTVLFVTHSIAEAVFLADRVVTMTARPGRVAEVVTIDLPRPRDLALMNTPEFGRYVSHIRALLNARGGLD